MKRKSKKVSWALSLAKKNATPRFKEHCTKTDISLVVIGFFFSQTNLKLTHYLLAYWIVLATIFLHLYLLILNFILRILKFIRCSYAIFIKTSKVLIRFNVLFVKVFILKMLLCYVLFSIKKPYLLTWNCC